LVAKTETELTIPELGAQGKNCFMSSHPLSIPYGATVACWFNLAHHAPSLSCPLDVVVGVWEVMQPTVSLRCNLLCFQCGFGCFLTFTHLDSHHILKLGLATCGYLLNLELNFLGFAN